jgi:ribonucleotide reductase alpha subunit
MLRKGFKVKKQFVGERFILRGLTKWQLNNMTTKFGFGGFGEATYYRTYSRLKSDGTQEHWADTVIRVIEGVFSVRKDHYAKHGLPWDDNSMQNMAYDMAVSMFEMKWLPPGRGLWAMGTEYVYERGGAALNNCGAVDTADLALAADWAMDMLMCGVGVGFNTAWNGIAAAPDKSSTVLHVVKDSREGWVESMRLLIESYTKGGEWFTFDYSRVRPAGSPINGFGGTASGPAPLIELHGRIESYLDAFCAGEIDATRCTADIFNAIGACVVAGNVRRSAEIALGSAGDETFLDLKDLEKNPDRAEISWMSNNTVVLDDTADFEHLPAIAERIRKNGEPGIMNLINVQKYGRYGKEDEDKAWLSNPCMSDNTTVLTPNGIRSLKEVGEGDLIWSETGWTSILKKWPTGIKPVYKYITTSGLFEGTENHRVLCEGEKVEAKDAWGIDQLIGPSTHERIYEQDVMDGLVVGDGSKHMLSKHKVYLTIGENDQDYFDDQVKNFIIGPHAVKYGSAFKVKTTISPDELPPLPERAIPERYIKGRPYKVKGFLRGLFSANGSIVGQRVTLKAVSKELITGAQLMLSSIGISSYITTNKASEIKWQNGTYTSKVSYDLNITKDRQKFLDMVGFIQKYKNQKLADVISGMKRQKMAGKSTYEIIEKTYLGDMQVYDITVDNEPHTFWSGGVNISNCAEIPLESFELCNLAEVFPSRCVDESEFYASLKYATFYASTVSLLPTHRPETNSVIARNRRIGVSLSGIADMLDAFGATELTRRMRIGYDIVKETNEHLTKEAGVPSAIRVTTVKPSGTISQLAGVSSGMHFPTFQYAIRRMRVGNDSAICAVLKDSGVPHEPDTYSANTTVFEFPIDQGKTRKATDVSAWEQFSLLAMLQREWSDNMVSCSIYFDPDTEGHQVEHMLAQFAPVIKSVSMLPHTDAGAYAQMPYEGITKEEYGRRVAAMPSIDWSKYGGSDGAEERFCSNGTCSVDGTV